MDIEKEIEQIKADIAEIRNSLSAITPYVEKHIEAEKDLADRYTGQGIYASKKADDDQKQ